MILRELAMYKDSPVQNLFEQIRMNLLRVHPLKALLNLLEIAAGLALCLMVPFMILFTPAAVCWMNNISIEKIFRLHMQPEDLEKEAARDALDQGM